MLDIILSFERYIGINAMMDIVDVFKKHIELNGLEFKNSTIINNDIKITIKDDDSDLIGKCISEAQEEAINVTKQNIAGINCREGKGELTMDVTTLKDTVSMMTSDDYKERFKAEYYQLKLRIEGLEKMLKSWDDNTLSFKPNCPRGLYEQQLKTMNEYIGFLLIRAQMEKIEVK